MRRVKWGVLVGGAAGLLLVTPAVGQSPAAGRLAADAAWLSADARDGRLTGSAGAGEAAAWLARRFREARLLPGVSGGWFQEFRIANDAPALKGTGLDTLPNLSGTNVIGIVRGRDPALRGQAVVVGAHYDHLGRGILGARDGAGAIHNGADDNASGTATLVEIARILSRDPPRRSVVFVAFSGEEEGLLGSAAYVKTPAVPMSRTVAMVNLDMVGRLRENRLLALGVETALEFRALLDSLNVAARFDLRASGNGNGASDHASFYQAKLPVIHLFTDLHEDYHRASDDSDKLNADGMGRIADFTAALTRALADRTAPLTFVDRPPPAPVAAGNRGSGAWLGSIPDMAGGGPGVRFSGVTPGSPADVAGLKADDVLVRIGDREVVDLQAMSDALRIYKPGDTVAVVVRRGVRIDTLRVVLGRRGS